MRHIPVTYLFVPGDRPDRFDKALSSGADITVLDLEDAVMPGAKDDARQGVVAALSGPHSARVCVRINGVDTPWYPRDMDAMRQFGARSVMVPKAEDPEALARLGGVLDGVSVIPIIETAIGLDRARDLARVPGVQRLAFGSVDFQVDLGIEGEGDELLFARSQLVLASRLAGIAAPVDGVTLDVNDADRTHAEALRSRQLGFGAKLCIHPAQLPAVHAAFLPTPSQLDWARALLSAAEAHRDGAFTFAGRLVDKPVIAKARALLARA